MVFTRPRQTTRCAPRGHEACTRGNRGREPRAKTFTFSFNRASQHNRWWRWWCPLFYLSSFSGTTTERCYTQECREKKPKKVEKKNKMLLHARSPSQKRHSRCHHRQRWRKWVAFHSGEGHTRANFFINYPALPLALERVCWRNKTNASRRMYSRNAWQTHRHCPRAEGERRLRFACCCVRCFRLPLGRPLGRSWEWRRWVARANRIRHLSKPMPFTCLIYTILKCHLSQARARARLAAPSHTCHAPGYCLNVLLPPSAGG